MSSDELRELLDAAYVGDGTETDTDIIEEARLADVLRKLASPLLELWEAAEDAKPLIDEARGDFTDPRGVLGMASRLLGKALTALEEA